MSDVQARPAAARGRGSSARGGRGGLSSRGGRGTTRSATTNGDSEHTSLPTLEDQGEIADLNKTHGSNLPVLKELFPNWSEVDLLYALKETDGDVTVTIERIAEGKLLLLARSLFIFHLARFPPCDARDTRELTCPTLCL